MTDMSTFKPETMLSQLVSSASDLLLTAIEACPVNITIADMSRPDTPLIYVNPAFSETTGYGAQDVLGQNCRFLQGPKTDPEAIEGLRRAIRNEESVEVEIVNYRRDGSEFINALKMAPVHGEDGRLISFVGIQSDVTEERAREKARLQRQRLEMLGQLSGEMAHQINNLLQPILSLTTLNRETVTDEALVDDFDVVLESARQAAAVVQNTLGFSRHRFAQKDICLAAERVEEDLSFIRALLPAATTVSFSVEPAAEKLAIGIDSTLFCQVLTNLVVNASQAMQGRGHIDVIISKAPNAMVSVAVCDQGPGIPKDLRSQVLKPFYTTKPEGTGTGLGLPVASRIIGEFGGTLSVGDADTERCKGCRISILLPALVSDSSNPEHDRRNAS